MRFFSPWKYTVDPASVALLEPTGWTVPDPDGAHAKAADTLKAYRIDWAVGSDRSGGAQAMEVELA